MAFLRLFYRSCSLKSWLWRLWLSFPNTVRARVYHILLYFFGRRYGPSAYRIPLGIYAKALFSPEEALATEFVRRNTTIPVPKVIDVLPCPFIWRKNTIMITKEATDQSRIKVRYRVFRGQGYFSDADNATQTQTHWMMKMQHRVKRPVWTPTR